MHHASPFLFLGLSEKSTGETTWILNALETCKDITVDVVLNNTLQRLSSNSKMEMKFYSFEEENFNAKLEKIVNMIAAYEHILFIDITAFCLESNINESQKNQFFSIIEKKAKEGYNICFMDYLSTFCRNTLEYNRRKQNIQNITNELIHNIHIRSRAGFYFKKIFPERCINMIHPVVPGTHVLRSVPVTYPEKADTHIVYYRNQLWKIHRSKSKKSKLLIAIPGITRYSLQGRIINNIIHYLINGFLPLFAFKEIVIIDSPGFIKHFNTIKGTQITCVSFLSRNELLRLMGEVTFVCLFSPYSSLGSIAVCNSIPVVTVCSSIGSQESTLLQKLFYPMSVPRFNALGIWEDFAFYDYLKADNPYFDFLCYFDLANPDSFEIIYQTILSYHDWRSESYSDIIEKKNLQPLNNVLKFIKER